MLNKLNERELAYVVQVESITPMDADRLECAHIGGWHCVVGKGEFKEGDYAVYFEIDSQLPETEPFTSMEFLKSKRYKIKSQKIRGEISQGLLVPLSAWNNMGDSTPTWITTINSLISSGADILNDEARFLTKELGVTYAVVEDNRRKGNPVDKYTKMTRRHPKLAKTKLWNFLYNKTWGRKLLFSLFGKKKDNRITWPAWVVKTDEERCQNLKSLFKASGGTVWLATEKIEGSSATFTMKGNKFYACSRNIVLDKIADAGSAYLEIAEKYHMKEVCEYIIKKFKKSSTPLNFITIQGEVYGGNIQKRNYGNEHRFAIFNVIFGYKNGGTRRLNPIEMHVFISECVSACGVKLECVPIVHTKYILPSSCEEVLAICSGESQIDGGMREGLVFRSKDGTTSFKAVSNEYLLKYHG